ncbi:MAG: hypothetical protein OEZ16_08185 [Chromatiales bacterium]|nr:hypothetical protein [Chromatiales bacterium]
MKTFVILLLFLPLGGCCLIDACAARNKPDITPVEASDRPLQSLDSTSGTEAH